ncbi:MAG: SwmB domain-containing protein, partial [Clostridia bacterium]|nr:SwmB domain-containing protein [Clostridia bacterium]
ELIVTTNEIAPVLLSAETTTNGKKIIFTFNKNMTVSAEAPAGFTITVNEIGKSLITVETGTSPDTIELTLEKTIYNTSRNIKVSYTTGTITAEDEAILESFLEQSVTNNSTVEVPSKKHSYSYGDSNQLEYIELSSGKVVRYEYDVRGNLIRVRSID